MSEFEKQISQLLSRKRDRLGVIQGIREIHKGHYGKRIIYFWSLKNGKRQVVCESGLERDHALLMEFDNDIAEYFLQPLQVRLEPGVTYTPDAMVVFKSGEIIFRQVKHAGALEDQKVIARMAVAKSFFRNHDYRHEIWTEKDISTQPEQKNREFIYKNTRLAVTERELDAARQVFAAGFSASMTHCYEKLREHNLPTYITEYLILERWLNYDRRFELTVDSKLTVETEDGIE